MENNLLPFEKENVEIVIKKDCEAVHGIFPEERTISDLLNYGIVNINKPKGPTSHQISDYVKKILKVSKAGHSGTLDPAVTGVLPIALGRSTRIVRALLTAGKEYVGIMRLHQDVSDEKLNEVVKKFTGKIKQLPPIKSAVKRRWREREVYYFEILERDDKEILFKTGVQAGTYIRKLIHDMGQYLGVGAHMQQLIRTKAGPFNFKSWCSLQDLSDEFWNYRENKVEEGIRKLIQPIEKAVEHLPKIWICDNAVDTLCHGAQLHIPGVAKFTDNIKKGDLVALMTMKNMLIGLATAQMNKDEILNSQKGMVTKTDAIIMNPGTYPKFKKTFKKEN